MVEIEKLQEKLGEALGLEMAAQKAVEELGSKGLLDKNGMLAQLQKMQSQAGNHQSKLEETVRNLANVSEELDSSKIQEVAQEDNSKVFKYDADLFGTRSRFFRSTRIPMSCRRRRSNSL